MDSINNPIDPSVSLLYSMVNRMGIHMSDDLEEAKRKIFERAQREAEELERAFELLRAHGMIPTKVSVEVAQVDPEIGRVRRHAKGWPKTIVDLLGTFPHGATRIQLRDAVAKTHLGPRLQETNAAFYGSIDKLKARNTIVDHEGRLFLPFLLKRYLQDVQAGRIAELPPTKPPSRHASIGLVLDFIRRHGSAESRELVELLVSNPLAGINNRNSVYNLLSRMVQKGSLMKAGNTYTLPSNETGEAHASPDTDQGSNPDLRSKPSHGGA